MIYLQARLRAPGASRRVVPYALLLLALPALAGCIDESPAAARNKSEPTVDVAVVVVSATPTKIVRELPGRVVPARIAEVRARVSGLVTERLFSQGSAVKAGDPLYKIDPAPFVLERASAEASLEKAKAVAFQAEQQAKRSNELLATRATSQAQYEIAMAAAKQADAEVALQAAKVEQAKLNLEYTTIRAPIGGKIGRALVTEGALIGQNDTTFLATIQDLENVYVDFTQSAADIAKLRRDLDSGALEKLAPDVAPIELVFDDGSVYSARGRLLFSDAAVDASTGQVILRAEFPNPRHDLLPGMYVRGRVELAIDSDAITVPPQAIQRNSAGASEVYVVDPDNKTERRIVKTGGMVDHKWIVTDGLKEGERIVVEGFQKIDNGSLVKPISWQSDAQTQSAAKAAPQR